MSTAPTLVILAAGMGSRYGGGALKQIDPVGPNGEIIIDYSIRDAALAGFKKVVFVIKSEMQQAFSQSIARRAEKYMEVDYAFQRQDDLPPPFLCPEGRIKPWGTGHAVYAARNAVTQPFGVINADDFLGRQTFLALGDFLKAESNKPNEHCIVSFRLENTLSENGTVSRGVCVVEDNALKQVTEHVGIAINEDGQAVCNIGQQNQAVLSLNSPVSMNVWGFKPSIFSHMDSDFSQFLKNAELNGDMLKDEYYLPAFVDRLIKHGEITVKALSSADKWYGVTYKEDKPTVQSFIKSLHEQGIY